MMDIPTRESLSFFQQHVPATSRVLEIGCGNGKFAAALGAKGHEVVAIDADEKVVLDACRRGVAAQLAIWPKFEAGVFDAVFLSRTLHHLDDLTASVRRISEVLRPGGMVVIDDFDREGPGTAGLEWMRDVFRQIAAEGPDAVQPSQFLDLFMNASDISAAWRHWHGELHHLHAIDEMRTALSLSFETIEDGRMPHLYRYFDRVMKDCPEKTSRIEALLKEEQSRIARAQMVALGWRFVGRLRTDLDTRSQTASLS